MIVDALAEYQGWQIQKYLQNWKENDDPIQLAELEHLVRKRIDGKLFVNLDYATFFTEGLPYSLILKNSIPCTYVHLSLRPDLFVFNGIMFKDGECFHSAVVFSPVFFSDEETNWLVDFFRESGYYIRALKGRDATVAQLDFHAQYFPFDILHLCSHGGEVDGYEMTEHFVDCNGNKHVVEFDEVIGFTPVPERPAMVRVHRKAFPRKLDGMLWRSPELHENRYPNHVISSMWKSMLESKGRRKPKGRIAMSCAIRCADSIHQGQLNTLASFSSPLVFNNTCWSWHEVAAFFLACGARGYLGTLWDIGNAAAVTGARAFYKNLYKGTVLSAFTKALKAIEHTPSKDIYIYWGLHFATLRAARNRSESKHEVRQELTAAARRWMRYIQQMQEETRRQNAIDVLKLILQDLAANFESNEIDCLKLSMAEKLPELSYSRPLHIFDDVNDPQARSFLEHPMRDPKT